MASWHLSGADPTMSNALLRARRVLSLAGLPSAMALERVDSARNEVWLSREYAIRVASNVTSRRLSHEANVLERLPAEVPHPGVLMHGRALFGEWTILARVPAVALGLAWPDLDDSHRAEAIGSLARALRSVHLVDASDLRPPFEVPGNLECPHQLPADAMLSLIERLRSSRAVDRGLLDAAECLARTADQVLGPKPATLVHGDFHLENVLWSGGRVRAVLDFEFARAGWPEIDLEVLLRYCDEPELHAAASVAHRLTREDFRPVVGWLRQGYPELFERPGLVERVNMCSLSYDLRDLALSPPDRPVRQLETFHPVNRLRRLLDGSGLLQLIEW